MTFKTVLTVIGPNLGTGDLKLASALCGEISAHLAVLAVALAAPPPMGGYAAIMSDAWLRERQADMDRLEEYTLRYDRAPRRGNVRRARDLLAGANRER